MKVHRKRGFTLVELLVVIAIIGVLVALLLPAVQAAREAARRIQCSNNLKQISLGLTNFESTHKVFPSAQHWDEHVTWFVKILPYMEQQAAKDCWDMTQPWHRAYDGSGQPLQLPCWSIQVPRYRCPSRSRPNGEFTPGGVDPAPGFDGNPPEVHPSAPYGDYAGNGGTESCCCGPGAVYPTGVFPEPEGLMNNDNGVILRQSWHPGSTSAPYKSHIKITTITDGLSNTLMLGERHVVQDRHGPSWETCKSNCDGLEGEESLGLDGSWASGNDREGTTRHAGIAYPLANGPSDMFGWPLLRVFGSWHPGICQFAMCDGSVSSLDVTISGRVLEDLTSRNSVSHDPNFPGWDGQDCYNF